MFPSKDGAYPSEQLSYAPLEGLEKLDLGGKVYRGNSLLRTFVNYSHKTFYNILALNDAMLSFVALSLL